MLVTDLTLEGLFLAGKAVLGILLSWERICQWKLSLCTSVLYVNRCSSAKCTLCRYCNKRHLAPKYVNEWIFLLFCTSEMRSQGSLCTWTVLSWTSVAFLKYDCDTHQRRPYPSEDQTARFWTHCFCNFRCEGHPRWPCSQPHWEGTRHSYLFESNSISLYTTKGLSSHGHLYVGKRSK